MTASQINAQWNDKFSKQVEFVKKLSMENEVLTKNQELGINAVVNKINQMESNLNIEYTFLNNPFYM